MTNARQAILEGLAKNIRGAEAAETEITAVDQRLARHEAVLIPARAQLEHEAQLTLFMDKVQQSQSTVERIESVENLPSAISKYLSGRNLPQEVRATADPFFDDIPWDSMKTLTVERGPTQPNDHCTVTKGFSGIAETGTVVMYGDKNNPHTANFLPEVNFVVMRERDVAGTIEDVWTKLRANGQDMPRALSMITGPSRTGDIAQQIEMGAHGPRQVHILLINDQKESE